MRRAAATADPADGVLRVLVLLLLPLLLPLRADDLARSEAAAFQHRPEHCIHRRRLVWEARKQHIRVAR